MSVTLGDIYLVFKGDSSHAIRTMDETERRAQSWASRVGGLVSNALSTATGFIVAQGVTRITNELTSLGPKLIGMGSDAEEMMGKFNVVFGNEADRTIGKLNEMTKVMGRSKFEARGFAASFQDTFVPMGFARDEAANLSTKLTRLTYDVASFNNSLEPDVARDFQSALVGNHETVRKYGIVITQAALDTELMRMGIEDGTKSASEQEKVMARLNLIMAGTTDAQGDAERTSKSWANTMRRFKSSISDTATEIGMKLLPVVTPLLQGLADFAQSVGPKVAEQFSNLIERLADSFLIRKLREFSSTVGDTLKLLYQFSTTGIINIKTAIEKLKGGEGIGAALRVLGLNETTVQYIEQAGERVSENVKAVVTEVTGIWGRLKKAYQEGGLGGLVVQVRSEVERTVNAAKEGIERSLPAFEAAAASWRERMLDWLTNPETGLLPNTIKKLNEWSDAIEGWRNDPAVSEKIRNIGKSVAKFLWDGLGKLFGFGEPEATQEGDNVMRQMVANLAGAIGRFAGEVIELGKQVGRNLLHGAAQGLLESDFGRAVYGWLAERGIVKPAPQGNVQGGVPGMASGGIVPGREGQAIPIVAHGGEVVLNREQQAALARETRIYINTLNLNGVQNVSAFLAELEALT